MPLYCDNYIIDNDDTEITQEDIDSIQAEIDAMNAQNG